MLRKPFTTRVLRCAAVFAAAFLWFWSIQVLSPSMPDNDPYYHIKVAQLYSERGVFDEFPWARFSSWEKNYFDKDFLFHVLLIPFAQQDLYSGAKLALAILSALVILTFYVCLENSGARYPLVFTFVLFAAGNGWVGRTVGLRTFFVSMLFCLAGLRAIFKERAALLFVLSVLYALSYNAAFLLPCFAAIYWLAGRLRGESRIGRLPAAAVAGVAAGTLLHPHRASALYNLLLQNVEVLRHAWFGDGSLRLAAELSPYNLKALLIGNPVGIAVAVISFAWAWFNRRSLSRAQTLLLILSGVFLGMMLISRRFVEYWLPFQVWFAALIFRRSCRPVRHAFISALCIALLSYPAYLNYSFIAVYFRHVTIPGAAASAEWLRANAKPGATVFTCDWDDSARLFFLNDRARYMVMADPLYMYGPHPELWKLWRAAVDGRSADPYSVIKFDLASDYVYCTKDFSKIIGQIESDPRFVLRVDGPQSVLYEAADS